MASTFQAASFNFSLNLANELLKSAPQSDACFSPASLTLVLAMCLWGSESRTKQQLKQVVFKGLAEDQISKHTMQMIKAINTSSQFFTLAYANRMYASKNYALKQQYVDKLRQDYRADILTADFAKNSGSITSEVNRWVERTTRDRIKNLVQPGSLTPDTVLLLINALYFKGVWDEQFRQETTKKQDFFSSSSKTAKVDMMSQKDYFKYAETPEVQVLELPYAESSASMLILLPKLKFGLSSFLNGFTDVKLVALMEQLRREEVEVKLPKFKIEKDYKLAEPLKRMGLEDLFSASKADLTGMVQQAAPRLYASSVVQKSFIDVTENGTEAAAATYMKIVPMSAQFSTSPPKTFVANHPFLFAILNGHRDDRHVLFLGQFYNN